MQKVSFVFLITAYCQLLMGFYPFGIAFSQSWNTVGIPCGASVSFLKVYKGNLYAASLSFTNPCGNYFDVVGKFNGSYWDTLGIFDRVIGGGIADIEECNGELYLAGGPILSGNPWPNDFLPHTNGLNKWDGTKWEGVDTLKNPNGVPGASVLKFKNDLYIGGSLSTAGGINCKKIVRYNGSTWNNMQGGVNGSSFPTVYAMAVYNSDLYVAGEFDIAGTVPCNNIARWNGTQWDSVGSGINGIIFSLFTDTINNVLYAGGYIVSAGGIPVKNIAKWNGVKWDSVGSGTNVVHAMTWLNNELYAGGGGTTGNYYDTVLAKWDGMKWIPITGINGGIDALASYKGNIYAGGLFTHFLDSVNGATLTNGLACYGNSCPLNVGIGELQVSRLKFKVFPNPAKKEITIELDASPPAPLQKRGEYVVRVKNSLGQEIYKKEFSKQLIINTSQFPKGLCLVEVCTAEGRVCHTEKVVIE